MGRDIQLLDATIRDGGFGFEDAEKNGLSHDCFGDGVLGRMVDCLERSGADIVELGAIERSAEDKRRFGIFQDIRSISQALKPRGGAGGQMYAALYRGPDTPVSDIPPWDGELCEAVRVILRYSELQKSLDFCAALSRKGYRVFVQPMVTMRYTEEELRRVVGAANDMGAYALYFVDSYGYMQEADVLSFFRRFDEGLEPGVRIGFHAHNNMNLAFSNARIFLEQETDRGVIVDACAMGLGQGAGNLQTEIIADYLNSRFGKSYRYGAVLELCEIVSRYWKDNMWGYSVEHFLPARHRTAYKYAVAMRRRCGLSLAEIDRVLEGMPGELRQRYTPENLERVLRSAGIPPGGRTGSSGNCK